MALFLRGPLCAIRGWLVAELSVSETFSGDTLALYNQFGGGIGTNRVQTCQYIPRILRYVENELQ